MQLGKIGHPIFGDRKYGSAEKFPAGIALHATTDSQWMSNPTESAWRIAAVNEFIDWALAYTNVYFVTYRDLAHFTQDPMDTTAAPTGAVFQTVTSTPASDTNRCTNSDCAEKNLGNLSKPVVELKYDYKFINQNSK